MMIQFSLIQMSLSKDVIVVQLYKTLPVNGSGEQIRNGRQNGKNQAKSGDQFSSGQTHKEEEL